MCASRYKDIEVMQIPAASLTPEFCYIPSIKPGGQRVLAAGTVQKTGHRPLLCDILLEEDVAIKTRDGTILFADIYRPPEAKSVPAIISAGPFGNKGGPYGANFDKSPFRFGCPRIATSGLEKFEGLDPGYWCCHGYAIVHTDCRGTWNSTGDAISPSKKEGEDNYDIIEFIADQPWCNGKTSMAGNSYLAFTQYFAGAENPPHLTCLAPWEGFSSFYEDVIRPGGCPNPGFSDGIMRGAFASLKGSKVPDVVSMCYKYPTWNSYWEDHRPVIGKINVPIYLVASWTNFLHVTGTLRVWQQCSSKEKWLRIHNTHEWPDLYDEQNTVDLRRFFDYYLKDIQNDWPYTPRVRMCILNAGGKDVINRPELSFPLQRQQPLRLYLNPQQKALSLAPIPVASSFAYDATSGDVVFRFPVNTAPMEFTGYIKLSIWAEAEGSDDMDVFATIQKFNTDTGLPLKPVVVDVGRLQPNPDETRRRLLENPSGDENFGAEFFNAGPIGCLRASHRELDKTRSTEFQPVYSHREEQMLVPGQIVQLYIAIPPYGFIVNKGEEVRLTISGYHPDPHCRPTDPKPRLRNRGRHIFHTGGNFPSHLVLMHIP